MIQFNDFNEILNGRKSVKVFDSKYKIPHKEMDEMITKATKAPSSVNMQPWRIAVIESDEAKEKTKEAFGFNVKQLTTSSAMMIIFGDLRNYEKAEQIYNDAVEQNHMTEDIKTQLLDWILPYYKGLSKEGMKDIVNIDSSLMAMQFMLIAKAYGYDTNPIGGFDKENIAEIIGYDSERYIPVLAIAIGKKAQEAHDSVRLPVHEIREYL
ncbi:nitroreductase family protein [Staphylococcus saccharolyticus]|uniref:NAD(P)H-flavin oxidoreductase n=1 Tax=Staphylococcus saccharolyticus TaxID=33028 RepID=A0A380GZX5_9STAP|nr:nitroreductase family protein [Staphylococcus saccharolyticus]MBL7564792.1 nitroreductase family protein [Staphylococcus saccharolyticus]MBL7570944.1 nitroreductase family protein [Staphylococcus saccharolyticus]QQB98802.1 nitroreductase family protein [Staphylococcus saccharolyticus]QRJ66983.1 nitroreductase family protein [Staphylococcus saccharolyticus]RTX95256.1 nitroreductase family protein [Staphylococcus saccharolyticus]